MEARARVFKYEMPEIPPGRGKGSVSLCRTDIMSVGVQAVKVGGETNLHAHPGSDGIWLVLSGRARFYEDKDVVTAELGKHEGILIPHGVKYWFESASEEPLEIVHIVGRVPNFKGQTRINYAPILPQMRQRGVNAF